MGQVPQGVDGDVAEGVDHLHGVPDVRHLSVPVSEFGDGEDWGVALVLRGGGLDAGGLWGVAGRLAGHEHGDGHGDFVVSNCPGFGEVFVELAHAEVGSAVRSELSLEVAVYQGLGSAGGAKNKNLKKKGVGVVGVHCSGLVGTHSQK